MYWLDSVEMTAHFQTEKANEKQLRLVQQEKMLSSAKLLESSFIRYELSVQSCAASAVIALKKVEITV